MKRHRAKLIRLDQIAKAVAKANGQRLSDLVNTAGITYRQYRRIVIGESDTSLGTIQRLADVLGVPPCLIMGDENDYDPNLVCHAKILTSEKNSVEGMRT